MDSADLGVREKRRRRTRRRTSMSERQTDRISNAGSNEGTEGDDDDDDEDLEEKFLCRVPVRTIDTVLRPRNGVRSLRIKSLGTMTGLPNSTTTRTADANGTICDDNEIPRHNPPSIRRMAINRRKMKKIRLP